MTMDQNKSSKKLLVAIGLAGLLLGGLAVWGKDHLGHLFHSGTHAEKGQRWQCPMHPSIIRDEPGTCPICGMTLVPMDEKKAAETASPAKPAERKILLYRSPMDPQQTSPTPRKDGMGMDYVPVYESETPVEQGEKVKGLATVDIDPERQQIIGLHTAPVTKGAVGGSWRTVGRVQVDPTQVRKLNV